MLESDARVKGQIFTPALSMRLGAILDGDCLFVTPEPQTEPIGAIVPGSPTAFQLDDPVVSAELSVVLSHEPDEELEEFLLSA